MSALFVRLARLVTIALFLSSSASHAQYYVRGHLVQDLKMGVEWMRCTVGQRWDPAAQTCAGEAVKLNQQEALEAIKQADEQLGPGWRLPSLDELESLVCDDCDPPKIDQDVFPNTMAEPYWTGDRNFWSFKNVWTVSFMTGDRYGRFFPEQQMMVRLVRDKSVVPKP